ncbi:hypothetical protein PINS_up000536 [Pythium insidiosum]|nr:hypothetical protein PINS_up000536 [Pythium insidiosum]
MAGVCSFYSPVVRQFVKRHLRCSYDNVVKHRRWHTLVTSSFLCVRSSEAVLLGFAMVELIASFRSFFDQLAVGNRAHATAAEEDKAMPRQLPFWGFLSLFASSAVVSNALELIAGKTPRVSGARPITARASVVSPLAAVLTWSLLARDQFGLALVGPAVAVVGVARGSRAMIGTLGAYTVLGFHWHQHYATRVSQQQDASI